MTRFPRHLQALGIALVAVAGLLSAAGDASACSSAKPAEFARACCQATPSPACGCCGVTQAPAESPSPAAGTARSAHALAEPATPCVCRPAQPSAPARSPETDTSVRPSDRSTDPAPVLTAPLPRVSFRHPLDPSPAGSPSACPLYLRTSRLLF